VICAAPKSVQPQANAWWSSAFAPALTLQ
jgi:hypothetical protein